MIVHVSHVFENPRFSCLSLDSDVLKRNKGMSFEASLPLPDLFVFYMRRFHAFTKNARSCFSPDFTDH